MPDDREPPLFRGPGPQDAPDGGAAGPAGAVLSLAAVLADEAVLSGNPATVPGRLQPLAAAMAALRNAPAGTGPVDAAVLDAFRAVAAPPAAAVTGTAVPTVTAGLAAPAGPAAPAGLGRPLAGSGRHARRRSGLARWPAVTLLSGAAAAVTVAVVLVLALSGRDGAVPPGPRLPATHATGSAVRTSGGVGPQLEDGGSPRPVPSPVPPSPADRPAPVPVPSPSPSRAGCTRDQWYRHTCDPAARSWPGPYQYGPYRPGPGGAPGPGGFPGFGGGGGPGGPGGPGGWP